MPEMADVGIGTIRLYWRALQMKAHGYGHSLALLIVQIQIHQTQKSNGKEQIRLASSEKVKVRFCGYVHADTNDCLNFCLYGVNTSCTTPKDKEALQMQARDRFHEAGMEPTLHSPVLVLFIHGVAATK